MSTHNEIHAVKMSTGASSSNDIGAKLGSSLLAEAEERSQEDRTTGCSTGISAGCSQLDAEALDGEGFSFSEITSVAAGPGTDAGRDLVCEARMVSFDRYGCRFESIDSYGTGAHCGSSSP